MKKIIILILVMMISFNVFAQSVSDNTGHNWATWTSMEKKAFALGWFSGLDALRMFLISIKDSDKITPEMENLRSAIFEWATFKGTIGDVVIMLDRVYSDPENRKYKIWDVMLTTFNKEWW